jgi:hypothetical protein
LLQPGIGDDRCRILKFVSADVDRAAGDARVAIEVDIGADVAVVPGVDAGRTGLVEFKSTKSTEAEVMTGEASVSTEARNRGMDFMSALLAVAILTKTALNFKLIKGMAISKSNNSKSNNSGGAATPCRR